MYAIIEVGAKQYKVAKDDIIEVEKQEIEAGKEIVLDKVLLAADGDEIKIGQPYLKGASVKADVQRQTRGVKTIAYKYRRRKASHTKVGHRQYLTVLKIKEIKL